MILRQPVHGWRIVLECKETLKLRVVLQSTLCWFLIPQCSLTVKEINELTLLLEKHQLLLVLFSTVFR